MRSSPLETAFVPTQGQPRHRRCRVMGVLNVTPDSFSDGGRWASTAAAVSHGLELSASGADIVDVGGESTRPGAERVDPECELARVLPVVAALATAGVPVSVDTTRAGVATQAIAAGARMVNDVSGGLGDLDMAGVVADAGVPWVIGHWRAPSRHMDAAAIYGDVVADVRAELAARVVAAERAGVRLDRIVVDPCLGFAKRAEHNWAILARLDELVADGLPVLVGASRKRFLPGVLTDRSPGSPAARDAATAATTVVAARSGAWGVRVHDVRASADAVRVAAAVDDARRRQPAAAARLVD